MGKERDPWTLRCLGVFFWLVTAAYAQAAVFTVNTNVDLPDASPGNGVCETAPGTAPAHCAQPFKRPTPYRGRQIILSPNTYLLTVLRELGITDSLTITGGGAPTTIIDGNKSVRPNGRVLAIGSGITVSISGVTIRNGGTGGGGGGIFNAGTLTLSNSTVTGKSRWRNGGGIFNDAGGTLTLINSIVSGNNAGVDGGGIRNVPAGTVTLTNSTVSGNAAGDDGGGIHNVQAAH